MHRLMPDALVHVSAGDLNLFLLGDAMEDEVGFKSMGGESARGPGPTPVPSLLTTTSGTPRSRLRCTSHGAARCGFQISRGLAAGPNWIRSSR
jgi:hypothetical protein